MIRDGDPRQHARLGLWLAVSLLLHAVAVPFLQTGTTSDGHAGEGLQVTLLGAAHESPASAAAFAGPGTPPGGEPARQRSTGRQRDSYPTPATTSVNAPLEPPTAPRAESVEADNSTPPAALVARHEPAANRAQPPPDPTTPARVEATEPDAGEPPAVVVARTEPEATDAESLPEVTQPSPGKAPQSAASDSETPEQTQDATDATTNASASPALASAAGASNASLDAGGERTLLALLHHAIDNRKQYPRLARRQRREGSATVLFRLHPDGALDRLELAASSGFDLLDRAALRAVADVAPFAPATRYLTRDKQFSVEVEFRLF